MQSSNENKQDHFLISDDKDASLLDAIFRAYPDLLFILDANGTILEYKAGKTSFLYLAPEDFIGKRMQDILPDEIGIKFSRAIEQVNRTWGIVSLEYQLNVPAGEHWFEAKVIASAKATIIVIVRDVTEHILAKAQTRRQLQQLEALRSIDAAITSSFDLNLTLSVLLRQTIGQLGVDAAAVLLLNSRTQMLEYSAGQGFHTKEFQQSSLRIGQGYAGLAALEKRVISVVNLQSRHTDMLRSPGFLAEGFVSYFAVPLIAKGEAKGVLEIYHRSQLKPHKDWLDFLASLAGQTAIAIDSAVLFQDLQRANLELTLAYNDTIEGWSMALDLRDWETEGHTRRVVDKTIELSKQMGIKDKDLAHIQRGALLHDMGKLAIPDHVLLKPGPLTDEEWKIMRQHPQYAYQMLEPIKYLQPALDIPRYHHEKWDGSGYPFGLTGSQIPLVARIFAIVDVYDAITSDRPYRPALSKQEALAYIHSQAGKHFDPAVVENFLRIVN
jgi:HD-GYP domain-containing protein (c-di-GMP phosphodiesterase class II)